MKSKKYNKGLSILPNNRSAKGGFIVDGYLRQKDESGKLKRVRKTFSGPNARELALAYRDQQETQDLKEFRDNKDNYRVTKLSPELEFQVLDLIRELREETQDNETSGQALLKTAVDFYITSPYRGTKDVTVIEVRDLYYDRDNYKRLSDKHRRDVENTFDKFCAHYGDRVISTITIKEIENFLERRECAAATKRIEYAHIHALFEWARKQTLLRANVVTAVDKPKIDHKEPESLTIDQAKNLLYYANEVEEGSLVAYFVLAIFAALRPYEVRRAQWEDFDWDENILRARQQKGDGFTRAVELPEIALKWLEHINAKEKTGPVTPSNITKQFALIRAAAGFKIAEGNFKSCKKWGLDDKVKNSSKNKTEWVNDVCRHTGITYQLKTVRHIGEVAEWAGNSPEVIKKAYKSVAGVTKASTEAYYNLTPENVLDLD